MSATLRHAIKVGGIALLCLGCGFLGAIVTRGFSPASFSVSYVELISIILTALGVLITTLGVFVGALAIIGWRSIEDKLRDHSYSYMASQLEDGKPLQLLLRNAARDAVYAGVQRVDDDEDFSDTRTHSEDRS